MKRRQRQIKMAHDLLATHRLRGRKEKTPTTTGAVIKEKRFVAHAPPERLN